MVQLNFVKDAPSAGTEDFCKGVLDDVERRRFASLITFGITRLNSAFNLVRNGFDKSGLDPIVFLALRDSMISIPLALITSS